MKPDESTENLLTEIAASLSPAQPDLSALKALLIKLLEHLSSSVGKTDENCRRVDLFFCLNDSWATNALPHDFHSLLTDMGGTLHDTFLYPEIAKNFESTPEQLLVRARQLKIQE